MVEGGIIDAAVSLTGGLLLQRKMRSTTYLNIQREKRGGMGRALLRECLVHSCAVTITVSLQIEAIGNGIVDCVAHFILFAHRDFHLRRRKAHTGLVGT